MGIKAMLLKLPLYFQVYIIIGFILIMVIIVNFYLVQGICKYHFNSLLVAKKIYTLDMGKKIFDNNLSLLNLFLIQYEFLIRNGNYIQLIFEGFETRDVYFQSNQKYKDKIVPIEPLELEKTPNNTNDIIYISCYLEEGRAENILYFKNELENHYINYYIAKKSTEIFKVPLYAGSFSNLERLSIILDYKLISSWNAQKIIELYKSMDGQMNKYNDVIFQMRENNYKFYRNIFNKYENNELPFLDILYNDSYYIFNDLLYVEEELKEAYIKYQSIYFESVFFENDTSINFDTWGDDGIFFTKIFY